MKQQLTLLSLLLILSFNTIPLAAQDRPTKILRHMVMITFKEGAPANEIKEVDNSFRSLATKLAMVKGYETGTTLGDGKNEGVTHVYSFSFASEKDLASYGSSPEHQKHIQIGKSIIERGQAIDYWIEK